MLKEYGGGVRKEPLIGDLWGGLKKGADIGCKLHSGELQVLYLGRGTAKKSRQCELRVKSTMILVYGGKSKFGKEKDSGDQNFRGKLGKIKTP